MNAARPAPALELPARSELRRKKLDLGAVDELLSGIQKS